MAAYSDACYIVHIVHIVVVVKTQHYTPKRMHLLYRSLQIFKFGLSFRNYKYK